MVRGIDEWKWHSEASNLNFVCVNSSCNISFYPKLEDYQKKKVTISDGIALIRHSRFKCPSCMSLYRGVILSVCNHLGKSEDVMFLTPPTVLNYGKQIVAS